MQQDLFPSLSSPSLPPPNLPNQKPKSPFIPATLENGLDKQKVVNHAMMWLRSLAKSQKNNAQAFLFHQMSEVNFKKSEFNQTTVIRNSLLKK